MSPPAPVSPHSGIGFSMALVDLFSSARPPSARIPGTSPLPPTARPLGQHRMMTLVDALRRTQMPRGWSGTPTSVAHDRGHASTFPEDHLGRDPGSPPFEATVLVWPGRPVAEPEDLKEALEDLEGAPREAADEGFPPPTEIAMRNAARVIRAMHGIRACRLEVYPTADGEVAIDAGAPGRSVILLCDASGGALCLANTGATHRRAHYSDADRLPDGFLREALAELVDHETDFE